MFAVLSIGSWQRLYKYLYARDDGNSTALNCCNINYSAMLEVDMSPYVLLQTYRQQYDCMFQSSNDSLTVAVNRVDCYSDLS